MTLAGYWLGQITWIREHFEMVVIGIVILSVLPIAAGVLKHWLAPQAKIPIAVDANEGK